MCREEEPVVLEEEVELMVIGEIVVILIKGKVVKDSNLFIKATHGREAELVQGHLEDIQEVRDSSVDRDLIEGACRMYSASIIRNMGILSLIVGLKIEMLRGFKLKFLG